MTTNYEIMCMNCKYRYANMSFIKCKECDLFKNFIEYDWDKVSYDNTAEPIETEGEGDNIRYL